MPAPGQGQRRSVLDRDETNLAMQLTLEDIEEILGQQKGKAREDAPVTDSDLALQLFAEDARALETFNSDRALAQQLGESWNTPQENDWHRDWTAPATQTVATYAREQEPARQVLARGPTARQQPTPPRPAPSTTTSSTDTWGGWFSSIISSLTSSGVANSTAKPTATAVPHHRLTGHTCVICQEPIRGAEIRAPCSHYYDKSCAIDLFEASTRDESLFPPRCCRQTIAFADVKPYLSANLVKLFAEKTAEFGTQKRVYCAKKTCSRFLGALSDGWFTTTYPCTSPGCRTTTCGRCRAEIISGVHHTCKNEDEVDREVIALGRSEGWQRCPSCSQMIELNMGCYHMTCKCKTEFCYLCRAIWKTCRCTQWDEQRLIAAAEERVDAQLRLAPARHAPARAVPPAPAPVRVRPAPPPAPPPRVPPRPTAVAAPVAIQRPPAPTRSTTQSGTPALRDEASRQRALASPKVLLDPRTTSTAPASAPVARRSQYGNVHNDVPALEDTSPWRHLGSATSSSSRTQAIHAGPSRNLVEKTAALEDTPAWMRPGNTASSSRRTEATPAAPPPYYENSYDDVPALEDTSTWRQSGNITLPFSWTHLASAGPSRDAINTARSSQYGDFSDFTSRQPDVAASSFSRTQTTPAASSRSAAPTNIPATRLSQYWNDLNDEIPALEDTSAFRKSVTAMTPAIPAASSASATSTPVLTGRSAQKQKAVAGSASRSPGVATDPVGKSSGAIPTSTRTRSKRSSIHHTKSTLALEATSTCTQSAGSSANPFQAERDPLADRLRMIRETIAEMRVNHDCQHEHWRYCPGSGKCQTCHHTLPIYLFRCLKCCTMACRRCRQNRL